MLWFLCSEFASDLQIYKKETRAPVLSCEFCEIFKNIFFTEQLWCFWMFRSNYKELFFNLTGRRASILKIWNFINEGARHRSFPRTFQKTSNSCTVKLNQSWIFTTVKRSKKRKTNSPENSSLFFTLFSPQLGKVVPSLFEVKSFFSVNPFINRYFLEISQKKKKETGHSFASQIF